MKIQYASDLHIEFPQNKDFLKSTPIKPIGDILILAGDIVPFAVMDKHADFFSYLSDNFKTTYWVPGNHEYYHSDLVERQGSFTENIKENVLLLNNVSVIQQNTRLIFSTMWTQIGVENEWFIRQRLNDFHLIGFDGELLQPSSYNRLHNESLVFIKTELENSVDEKRIVVTHHVPTLLKYPEKYRDSKLNDAFAIELHDLILKYSPEYWIYGHHHANVGDIKLGNTNVVTNQLGYVAHNEQLGFNNTAIINTIDDNQYNKVIFAQ